MGSADTRHAILNAAGQVFAEKGFNQGTIREICASANVNLAAVKYHFGDKENLYIQAVRQARNNLEAVAPVPPSVAGEPEAVLGVLISVITRRLLSPDVELWQHRLLMREFMEPSVAIDSIMKETVLPFTERLHCVLRQLLPDGVEDHTVRQFGFSIISQCVYYRMQAKIVSLLTPEQEYQQHFGPTELAEHITRFSIAAIRHYHCTNLQAD